MSGNRSKSAFFGGGWVTLNADFRGKGASPTNHSWYQSSRVIALSCVIKTSAVHHLVLSQCTRVTDGQTDRQTDRITTPKTSLAYARAVKRCKFITRLAQLNQTFDKAVSRILSPVVVIVTDITTTQIRNSQLVTHINTQL